MNSITWKPEHEEVFDDFFNNLPANKCLVVKFMGDRFSFITWHKTHFFQHNLAYQGPHMEFDQFWNGFKGLGYTKMAEVIWDDEGIYTRSVFYDKEAKNDTGCFAHTDSMSHYEILDVFLVDFDNNGEQYLDSFAEELMTKWYPDVKEDIEFDQEVEDDLEILKTFFKDTWEFWGPYKYCRKFCQVNSGCNSNMCKAERSSFVIAQMYHYSENDEYKRFVEIKRSYGYTDYE